MRGTMRKKDALYNVCSGAKLAVDNIHFTANRWNHLDNLKLYYMQSHNLIQKYDL